MLISELSTASPHPLLSVEVASAVLITTVTSIPSTTPLLGFGIAIHSKQKESSGWPVICQRRSYSGVREGRG